MDMEGFPPAGAHPGTLHFIPPNLSAFEPTKRLVRSANIHTLLWVGGLFDTFLSVAYPLSIAQSLGPTWSLMTASLGSAGKSWGVSSIARDAVEIAKIVTYIRQLRPGGKVVIMGHSTGCQDCMEYVVGAKAELRAAVDGVILQAPVSDRQAIESHLPKAVLEEANQLALKMCRERHEKDAMPHRLMAPVFGGAGNIAITARRWVDIASPGPNHDGADDYFSSDLSDERFMKSFGRLPPRSPLLILYGGCDESVPASVDKEALVSRWTRMVQESGGNVDTINGGIIPQASHNLNGQPQAVVQDLVRRVLGFVARLDNGDFARSGSL